LSRCRWLLFSPLVRWPDLYMWDRPPHLTGTQRHPQGQHTCAAAEGLHIDHTCPTVMFAPNPHGSSTNVVVTIRRSVLPRLPPRLQSQYATSLSAPGSETHLTCSGNHHGLSSSQNGLNGTAAQWILWRPAFLGGRRASNYANVAVNRPTVCASPTTEQYLDHV